MNCYIIIILVYLKKRKGNSNNKITQPADDHGSTHGPFGSTGFCYLSGVEPGDGTCKPQTMKKK